MKDTIRRTKVVDALQCNDFGTKINVKGWVRTHRSSKAVDFIALNDGSTIKNIQVVVDPTKFDAELLKQVTTGACISAIGTLVESQGAGQTSEIQCESLEVYGLCGSDYPMQKFTVCVGVTIPCRRKVRVLNTCANTLTCVFVPIRLVP